MKFDIHSQHRSLNFPFALELVEDRRDALEKGVRKWAFFQAGPGRMPRILVLSGSAGSTQAFGDLYQLLLEDLLPVKIARTQVLRPTLQEVNRIDALCAVEAVSLIVAIGGGSVIDVAKMVVRSRNVALMIVPSTLSSDCIASPISVLTDEQGTRGSFESGIPSCLFVDLELTRSAPLMLTWSGLGDILSNASALADVADYEFARSDVVNGFAKALSRAAYELVLDMERADTTSLGGHKKIATSLVLSGLAMSFAGNSMPCSGAEHLISHAIDHLELGCGTHGTQVGIATMFCSALRRVLRRAPIDGQASDFLRKVGAPSTPEDLHLSRDDFLRAVKIAPQMRPGRVTVLDFVTADRQLESAYDLAYAEARASLGAELHS